MLSAQNSGSLPPSDRDEDTSPDLRARIRTRIGPDFSQADLAREIGKSSGTVSRWLNGKPEGDVVALEDLLKEWELRADERVDLRRTLEPTRVTRFIAGVARSAIRMNDFVLLTGRAGTSKTVGLQLFCLENPSVILLTASQARRDSKAMNHELLTRVVVRMRDGEHSLRIPDLLRGRLRGSNRLIVIDDCHYLTAGGLKWAISLHNETGCPFMLCGNPNVLRAILRLPDEDQFTSRIGRNAKVVIVKPADAEELAGVILKHYAPEFTKDLWRQAVEVCSRLGHGRKLKKQLLMMREILDGGLGRGTDLDRLRQKQTEAQIAFDWAHDQLLTVKEDEA